MDNIIYIITDGINYLRENNIEISAKDKLKQKIEKLNTEFTNNYIE